MSDRVAITGMGVVSALGQRVDAFIDGLLQGRVEIDEAPWSAPGRPMLWSVARQFVPPDWMDERLIEGCDRFAQFALSATTQALADAGLEELHPTRTAIVHGTGGGGIDTLCRSQFLLDTAGPEAVSKKMMIKIWPNMAAAQIAMHWDLHGPQITLAHACAASVDAIGVAAAMIRRGEVDVAIVGGTESGAGWSDPDDPPDYVPAVIPAMSNFNMTFSTPDLLHASMPFDMNRRGIVQGEGSSILILESERHASERGAAPCAWVRGYGSLADGYHPSASEPTGVWQARAMQLALDEAGIDPSQVDALVAHATGTPKGDETELRAINHVFRHAERGPLVTSIKGHVGHPGSSAGGMGIIAAVRGMHSGLLPHTAGTTEIDPGAEFEVVTGEPRSVDLRIAQVNAFGFGGQNASVVIEHAI